MLIEYLQPTWHLWGSTWKIEFLLKGPPVSCHRICAHNFGPLWPSTGPSAAHAPARPPRAAASCASAPAPRRGRPRGRSPHRSPTSRSFLRSWPCLFGALHRRKKNTGCKCDIYTFFCRFLSNMKWAWSHSERISSIVLGNKPRRIEKS